MNHFLDTWFTWKVGAILDHFIVWFLAGAWYSDHREAISAMFYGIWRRMKALKQLAGSGGQRAGNAAVQPATETADAPGQNSLGGRASTGSGSIPTLETGSTQGHASPARRLSPRAVK